ncbi:uncharacterized protein LOC124460662 [Drosophila willistoni]|uniref:uncharacterized protein LOC124460662 n=1 Tax=Drosophila willistoni TaxID=7260 RepID=UPI001F083239|nr:uncharacterized protein LOC124460662 [Drosophila willistoni]
MDRDKMKITRNLFESVGYEIALKGKEECLRFKGHSLKKMASNAPCARTGLPRTRNMSHFVAQDFYGETQTEGHSGMDTHSRKAQDLICNPPTRTFKKLRWGIIGPHLVPQVSNGIF